MSLGRLRKFSQTYQSPVHIYFTYESLMIFVRSSLILFTRFGVPKRLWEMEVDHGEFVLKNSASAARASEGETPESRLSSSG